MEEHQQKRVPVLHTSVPVLYFGDLSSYFSSPLRVIAAALNPSDAEFPNSRPEARFPGASERTPSRHFAAMNGYFDHDPLWRWFKHFDVLLEGLGAGFRAGRRSRALHTDVCSPFATDPTYSRLSWDQQRELERVGLPLWSDLVDLLDPHVIVFSGSEPLRQRIPIFANAPWTTICGSGRKTAWIAQINVRGDRRLGVFGTTTQVPFGAMSYPERRSAGTLVVRAVRLRRIVRPCRSRALELGEQFYALSLINTFFLESAVSVSQAVRSTSRGAFFRIFIK
jgi:hypothetical protein